MIFGNNCLNFAHFLAATQVKGILLAKFIQKDGDTLIGQSKYNAVTALLEYLNALCLQVAIAACAGDCPIDLFHIFLCATVVEQTQAKPLYCT